MSRPPLSLVLLAAGLGSRFGGLKQLEPLGPRGTTLMDFSIHDARRAGFTRVVFVTRPELEERFQRLAGRYAGVDTAIALQRVDALPRRFHQAAGRARPWGTGQAVLAAREQVPGPFAVLNADDLYGRDALEQIAGFLRSPGGPGSYAVVGYRLEHAASDAGGVNRAVLERLPDGRLSRIVEVRELVWASDGRFRGEVDGEARIVAADALVSMNLWGFTPSVFSALAEGFERFLEEEPAERAEFCLPDAMEDLLQTGRAKVRVLPTDSRWCGVTYPADRKRVEAHLIELVEAGEYPDLP